MQCWVGFAHPHSYQVDRTSEMTNKFLDANPKFHEIASVNVGELVHCSLYLIVDVTLFVQTFPTGPRIPRA